MASIGEKITTLRKQKNMTQADLGKELFVSPQAVSKWENGLSEPDIEMIKKISAVFNISTDELIGLTESSTAQTSKTAEETTVTDNRIIIAYCDGCGAPFYTMNEYEERDVGDGKKKYLCKKCVHNEKLRNLKSEYSYEKEQFKKSMIFGILTAVALFALSLAFVRPLLPMAIICAILNAYAGFTFVSQLFWTDIIFDIMDFFFSKTIHWPGLIFTFDWDGLKWLILMKILFAVITFVFTLFCDIIGILFAIIFSMFSFPFNIVTRNKKEIELSKRISLMSKNCIA
ncbi:MAG: helix-turn-helix transcriptional regulator [Eubacteriales bacterium]|nr:helix-turn-helix transcriptional regulator [Eubacteriales bacterium]